MESVRPKVEDVEDSSALQADNAGSAVSDPAGEEGQKTKMETVELQGLKPSSTDPLLGSSPDLQCDATQVSGSAKAVTMKSSLYAPLRERIAYSDERKLFIENEDLALVQDFSALTTDDQALEPSRPPPDLSEIFPDLQPLGVPDVTNGMAEGKEKADKKTEREGNKRVDDSGYTKMAPMGKFMMCKPVLLGPLHPARRWKNGRWVNPEEPAVTEVEGSGKISDDPLSELFEGVRPQLISVLAPQPPKDTKKRAEHAWSPEEDALLKRLADKYPNNWSLVTDVFNSSRVAIPFDKRMPWECFERWNTKFGGTRCGPLHPEVNSPAAAAESSPPPVASSTSQAQMMTRGVKRLASASVSQNQNAGLISSDMLKRRRHTLMYETIRRVAKKREIAQKASMNQRKSSNVHDTHSQYNKMPKLTPAELSRMKAEKEARDHQEMLIARRRHEEMARQQQLRLQAAAQGQAPAAAAAQPQQANGATRLVQQQPAQSVPQIRAQPVPQVNISQQQRMPAPMASAAAAAAVAATRMAPQVLQARALAAAQSQVQAQLQAQIQVQGQGQVPAQVPTPAQTAGVNNMQNSLPAGAHLSPPYQSRAATSSPGIVPQGSPPHNGVPPSNAGSPVLPSTQPQMQIQAGQVPGISRPPGGIPAHYLPMVASAGSSFTQEQVDHAMRLMQQRTSLGQPQ
ncbi:hypothetical protein EDC04DRAFT_822644 [Pisolithus marmoratus]|nr:hypothetical protein EDC04DRAFT_822644 [Pisolithus marmoratus]